MNTHLPEYKTSHIPLATYLKMKGVMLREVSCDQRRGSFVFADVPRELIIEFNSGNASVEPNDFALRMSTLTQTAKRLVNEESI